MTYLCRFFDDIGEHVPPFTQVLPTPSNFCKRQNKPHFRILSKKIARGFKNLYPNIDISDYNCTEK